GAFCGYILTRLFFLPWFIGAVLMIVGVVLAVILTSNREGMPRWLWHVRSLQFLALSRAFSRPTGLFGRVLDILNIDPMETLYVDGRILFEEAETDEEYVYDHVQLLTRDDLLTGGSGVQVLSSSDMDAVFDLDETEVYVDFAELSGG
ncbi:MAG: hypothetical protein AAF125_18335, partial [Chloroflexota bacterium]